MELFIKMFLFLLILCFTGYTSGTVTETTRKIINNGTHYLVEGTTNFGGTKGVRSQIFSIPLVKLGSQHYMFSNYYQLNFFEAFRFCEDFGLNLMTIESTEESHQVLTFMREKLKIVNNLWTSGQDLGTKGEFTWLSSGKRMTHINWDSGQPFSNEKNHCVQVKKTNTELKFVNTFCWETADFLCEMKSCPAACHKE